MVVAEWTGRFPNLCHGEWKLYVDGSDVSSCIPTSSKDKPMNTLKEYRSWHFDKKIGVVFDYYVDGIDCEDWIVENDWWLDRITEYVKIHREIFHAINECDWRYGSCGGCI